MIRSSIDIGTNTVLLLVAETDGKELDTLYEDQRTPRLGKGVDKDQNLHPDSVERVIEAVKEFRQVLENRFPEALQPVVTATSAVRDAGNREEFIRQLYRETGTEVRVLSGEEEAEYTWRGALSMLNFNEQPAAVIDIGGGSTEVAVGTGITPSDRHSFDIGSVRFTERFLRQSPPSPKQVEQCRTAIREELERRSFNIPTEAELTGVAGTVTSLAYMDSGLEEYCSSAINGRKITVQQIDKWTEILTEWTSERLLREYPVVMKGRADVFLAGLLVLEGFMETYGFSELTVSTGGIRHGVLLKDDV